MPFVSATVCCIIASTDTAFILHVRNVILQKHLFLCLRMMSEFDVLGVFSIPRDLQFDAQDRNASRVIAPLIRFLD